MKKTFLALAGSTLITGALLISCSSTEEKVENAKEDVIEATKDLNNANELYLIEVENYKKEIVNEIEANDKTIADLEAKIEKDKKTSDTKFKEDVATLKEKNKNMKERIQNFKAEGKEKWQKFKEEFSHDMNELGKALKDVGTNNVK